MLALVVISGACGSSKRAQKVKSIPGTWQKEPIVIDGDSRDWPSPYPNYDAKSKIAYATSNDGNNLYVTMETGDQMTQIKILKQGLTVSIDTSGGKSADFHINFPLQNDIDQIELSRSDFRQDRGDQSLMENRKLSLDISRCAQDDNQFSLDGFAGCNGGYMVKQAAPCGIRVSMRIDEYKELVWEAVIPFKLIYNKDLITAKDAGKPISVCFAVKPFKKTGGKTSGGDGGGAGDPGMNNGMGSAGTNSGINRGGRGGGSHGGSHGGSTANPMDYLYETTHTWKFFSIAFQ